jgi:hypothetical protein
MEHRWIVGYWKADISTMCSSACSIQQRKPDRYSFPNGLVIYHWIRYFQVFPNTLHIWNRKWKWSWWNFVSGLVCLITGWMEHILGQTRISSVQNSGRDSRTSQTDTQTDRQTETTVAIRRFIHEWICVKTKSAKTFGPRRALCGRMKSPPPPPHD